MVRDLVAAGEAATCIFPEEADLRSGDPPGRLVKAIPSYMTTSIGVVDLRRACEKLQPIAW